MAFLFAYSSREKTPAARRLEDDVPSDIKKKRLQELIDAFRTGREARSSERVGKIHLILVEGAPRRDRGADLVSGRDDGNRVHVFPSSLPDGTQLRPGDFAHAGKGSAVYPKRLQFTWCGACWGTCGVARPRRARAAPVLRAAFEKCVWGPILSLF